MKNRRLIYEMIVAHVYVKLRHPMGQDKAIRKANIFAVQNTEKAFQGQRHGYKISEKAIEKLKD